MEKVVDLGHEAFVPDHQPGAAKDLRHLFVINGLVDEDASVNLAGLRVNDGVLLRGTHTVISFGQPAWRVERCCRLIIGRYTDTSKSRWRVSRMSCNGTHACGSYFPLDLPW